MNVLVKKASTQEELDQCLGIRKLVFVEEQKVPLDLEIDGLDEGCDHFLLFSDSEAVATARVRYLQNYAKIERVAVLTSVQGKGLGKRIMRDILTYLGNKTDLIMIKLSAQTHAIPFYERLGFHVCSETYLDAGIPHQDMTLRLKS